MAIYTGIDPSISCTGIALVEYDIESNSFKSCFFKFLFEEKYKFASSLKILSLIKDLSQDLWSSSLFEPFRLSTGIASAIKSILSFVILDA